MKLKPPFWMLWIGWFIGGLCDVIDGMVNMFTLCYFYPRLGMNWRFWIAKKQMQWVQKEAKHHD